jgi:hypothetical protein
MSKMKTKKKLQKMQLQRRKTKLTKGNLTNQQPMIWNWDKKISKGWSSKKTKVQ